jgi:hypothetical protein
MTDTERAEAKLTPTQRKRKAETREAGERAQQRLVQQAAAEARLIKFIVSKLTKADAEELLRLMQEAEHDQRPRFAEAVEAKWGQDQSVPGAAS